jgi:hypothetical protein
LVTGVKLKASYRAKIQPPLRVQTSTSQLETHGCGQGRGGKEEKRKIGKVETRERKIRIDPIHFGPRKTRSDAKIPSLKLRT